MRSSPSARLCCSPGLYWAVFLFGLASLSPVSAQGDFVNFETPQVKPITTASVGDDENPIELILVCNTPDNSVEIYDAFPPHDFLQRVPVGLGPATVKWVRELGRFYTCNFDGDSVSVVRIDVEDGRPFAALERTSFVGDQPSDITFDPGLGTAVVTLSGRSAYVMLSSIDLSFIAGETIPQITSDALPAPLAVKAPRRIEWLPDNRVFIQNFMGENPDPNDALQYDLDLWLYDPALPTPENQVEGLGSTNHSFAFTSDGEQLVVVGTLGRVHDAVGEVAVSQLPFGFVESRVWVLDSPAGAVPTVRAEPAPGMIPGGPPIALSRNLNRDYTSTGDDAVDPDLALSQPTDVVIIEDDGGGIGTIAVTAYHSDRITLLSPAMVLGGYVESQIQIPTLNPADGYTTSGPRGLAFNETTGLLYVACRLDNSLRVINPNTATVTDSQSLQNDPTPDVIREGRVFLYNATESSTSGFVSCASCHIDAATDALAWNLGVAEAGPGIPTWLIGAGDPELFPEWPSDKGPLVTQTLQGLVNWPVNFDSQDLLTNAPYHWRGDRPDFQAFNGAFVGLLGREKELEDPQMDAYTAFINEVRHPPNPEQAIDRIVPGTLDANDPDDWQLASGAKRGLQIFHNSQTDGQLGCVDCHSLPEGSDNTLTEAFLFPGTVTDIGDQFHPIETAALRNLVPREMFLHRAPGFQFPLWIVANVGTTSRGEFGMGSINAFNQTNFAAFVPGDTDDERAANLVSVTEYTREFDWGVAPAAGLAYTLDPNNPVVNTVVFDILEEQVDEANIGLAVIARSGVTQRGFWFDITATPPAYREEGTTTLLTRAAIENLALLPDSAVVLQGTPLGTERRVSNPFGVGTLIADDDNPPMNITPQPMAPMTYATDIPLFQQFLHVDPAANPPVTIDPQTTIWAVRTLQISALGLDDLHHEPPRRMRVTGDNIRVGAKLLFGIPTTNAGAAPTQILELDLYPTSHFTATGDQIWETEQELDPMLTFALLNGGPFLPEVLDVIRRLTTTPNLNPTAGNNFTFEVRNEDGTINAVAPFQPLSIRDDR